jgi:1-acyl-sn-glycerol-3-phosphate acyltransferase
LIPFLRLVLRSFLLLLLLVFGTLPTIISMTRPVAAVNWRGRGMDEVLVGWWTRSICRIFGIRVTARGRIMPGPVLLVANHISWMDILAFYCVTMVGFLSKAEVARWPLIGFMATMVGTVYHQRGNHSSAHGVIDAMQDRLAEGRRIAIFPEGGILPGDEVKVFHARLFRVAVESDCPVQPVMIRYLRRGRLATEMSFMPGESFMANFFRLLSLPPGVCELVFLDALKPAGRPRRELADEARRAVIDAYRAGLVET